MAISDIFKRKADNQVNPPHRGSSSSAIQPWNFARKRYADAYLWLVFRKIFDGMSNVHFFVDGLEGEIADKGEKAIVDLCKFVEQNISSLLWSYWSDGYIVIDLDENGKFCHLVGNDVRTDGYGKVIGHDWVVYSDAYRMGGKSDLNTLHENINNIDTFKSADTYLTESFGAFAIMCGKTMPMSQVDKEEFLDEIKNKFGISSKQYQIMVTTSEIDLKQLDFKIKELDLPGKVKDELMLIAGYFGVPYDLIPFSGKSTFANQEQAIIQFYRNCISPLAEVILTLMRYIKRSMNVAVLADRITFTIDNVPELADDRTAEIDYKLKVANLIEKMRSFGLDTTELEQQLQ